MANKMTDIEKEQWDNLYQYVKKDIMGYDDNQKLSQKMVLTLLGLTQGKSVANNNIKSTANYSFDIVLMTFKVNKVKIISAIKNKEFKTELIKFIYISKIIENDINDVYKRINKVKISNKLTEDKNVDNIYSEIAEYKPVTIETNSKLEGLW